MELLKHDQALISIIIPVYQVEDYLSACLDSVQSQTYPNWELLLIDDGSTDSSGALCDAYAVKDPRIRVFHQVNKGVSAARNLGIENASGEYLMFIDSDDYIQPDCLEVLLRSIVLHNADIVCCDYIHTPEALEHFDGHPLVATFRLIQNRSHYFRDMISFREFYWCCIWGKLYRTNLVQHCRYKSLRYGEDIVFLYDLLLQAPTVCLIPYEGYFYTIRNGSAVHTANSISLQRLSDELQMELYRFRALPEIDRYVFDCMLQLLAQRTHTLAYHQTLQKKNLYDEQIREAIDTAWSHRKNLKTPLKQYLLLLRHSPLLYRFLIRLKNLLHTGNSKG